MALGLILDDLLTIHSVQFPVTRQYEADTRYDANGASSSPPPRASPVSASPRKAVKGDTSYSFRTPGTWHVPSGTSGAAHNGQEAEPATVQTGITLGWEDIHDPPEGAIVTRRITDDTFPDGPITREIVYHTPSGWA